MNRKVIPCLVRDEYILGSGGVIGAEGSGGDVALELEFGPRWEGLVKYVTFRNALGEDPETVLVTADLMELRERLPPRRRPGRPPTQGTEEKPPEPELRAVYLVSVPAKAKTVAGEMSVTVRGFGVSEDGTETEAALVAATAHFRVLPGKWALPESEGFASPTAAQQLQAEIEKIQGDIVEAAKAADAKEAAQQSAAAAARDAERAQEARTGAETAQTEAQTAREEARIARAAAEDAMGEAQAAQMDAETAKEAAEAAQGLAQAAQGLAEAAKAGAESARATAQVAQGAAAGSQAQAAEKAAQADQSAADAQTWAGRAKTQAERAGEKADSSQEQADRAKYEADRAQAAAGGDFVTDPELDKALANMGVAPLVGPAELVEELLPGGVLFVTDEALPEDYDVTLEQLLAEGDKAYAGESDALESLLTVGVTKALGLRSDGEGSEYTAATLPSLATDIRALCAVAQAGGSYVLDGKTAVSHRQVQYYIIHKALASQTVTEGENWGWMTDPRTEMGALRREMAQLRALVGDVNGALDEINGEVV